MNKHFGWLGLIVGLALVPTACNDDDALPGSSAGTSNGGSGGKSSAGTGGSTDEAGMGGGNTLAGGGGDSAQGGSTTGGGGSTSGSAGKGGAPAHGGSSGKGGTSSHAGDAGESGQSGQAGAHEHGGEAGGGGEGGATEPEPIELAGTWVNTLFGETDSITSSTWSQDYGTGPTVNAISSFSNTDNVAILQAPADAAYSPLTFSRIVWLDIDGDHFYYCTVDYGLGTAEDAENSTKVADPSDPDNSGCGSFSWSKLTRP
jgi:hypothetical protein